MYVFWCETAIDISTVLVLFWNISETADDHRALFCFRYEQKESVKRAVLCSEQVQFAASNCFKQSLHYLKHVVDALQKQVSLASDGDIVSDNKLCTSIPYQLSYHTRACIIQLISFSAITC